MTSTAGGAATDTAAERHWICARRLRERRRQLGLTQADVVTRMGGRDAPLTNRTLSAMENGRGLDLGRLPDLAAALDCTITYLVGLTGDPRRWEPDVPLTPDTPAAPATAPTRVATDGHPNWILGPDPPAALHETLAYLPAFQGDQTPVDRPTSG
jgi:transcriptional regulator with XRE-family HTH domain